MKRICIGLVGDFSEKMHTHVALNNSIEHCRKHLEFRLETRWVSTATLIETIFDQNKFQGFWIVPGSPYIDDSAVYQTIRWARENDFPMLGSCDQPPFAFTAFSTEGEACAFELRGHRFFKGTLFQPSLDSTSENPNLLILDFFRYCARQNYGRKILNASD